MLAFLIATSLLADRLPRPSAAQLDWQDDELGMFVHLAPNTWSDAEYDDLTTPLSRVNPTRLDTDQWARVARDMGAKRIVFVAKHAGGFAWWQTKTTKYGVSALSWRGGKGDVMADLARSCRKYGLKLGVYLSPVDASFGALGGGRTKDPRAQSEYERIYRTQLTELLTRYGAMTEVWFDGSLEFDVSDLLQKHATGAVVFQSPAATIRWVGNEDGVIPYPTWNGAKYDPKTWGALRAADSTPEGDRWLPTEADARMRDTWFWNSKNASSLKTVEALVTMYEQTVGRGGFLLLNAAPDTSGLIPEADAKRAREFGEEIRRRYGTPLASIAGSGDSIDVELPSATTIDAVVSMEDISQGERVREYVIEYFAKGEWKQVVKGSAIGHKKIDRFASVRADRVRLRVLRSVGNPIFRRVSIYQVGRS